MMNGAAAGLGDYVGQSSADYFAGFELQPRRQHANHRDRKLRARQINGVDGDIAGVQPFQSMLEA